MRLLVGLCVTCGVIAGQFHVQAQDTVINFGVGQMSCGLWTEARRLDEASLPITWVNGFLSGVSFIGGRIRDIDNVAREKWLDNYCAKFPLQSLRNAAVGLSLELAIAPSTDAPQR